ncbi:MAG TPA: alginate export family protein [Bryobacterales bacterium]|nr:alginate export family protein [Bryobacterales bacterium]
MKAFAARLALCIVAAATALHVAAQQPPAQTNLTPSDELNKELPQWLRFSGEYRGRMEGFTGGGFKNNSNDLYFLNRLRLNMKLQPEKWLKFQFQAQDARVLGKNQTPAAPPYQDTMDLRLAYMEIGNTESGSAGLRVGRQELAFGEERLVGNVNWLNTARSFDAVRTTLRHGGYRLDAFASTVVVAKDGAFNHSQAGNDFHGLYGGIEKLVPNAVIEPYVFWRLSPLLLTERGTPGHLDFKTVGVRWAGKLPANFDYSTEIAGQTGSLGTDSIGAWAGHWLAGYTFTKTRYKPRLVAEYNYASGDRDPHDGKRGTFDQLYPTGHDKYGLADQVGWKNIHHVRGGVELKPRAKWLVMGKYNVYWLASARDALYNAAGNPIARVADGSAGRDVGQEIDTQAVYNLNRHVQLAGGYAYMMPGAFLKKATPGVAYSFPYMSVGYTF